MSWSGSGFLARRSVRTLLILLGINLMTGLLAGGVVEGYTAPQEEVRDGLANAMQNLNHERATAAADQAYVAANRAVHRTLLARGLTRPQDRLAAAALLERLREAHRLNGIHYSFGPARDLAAGPGRLSRLQIRASDVVIDMNGVTDHDLLGFARAVMEQLPGDVRITTLQLERLGAPARQVLDRLRAGEPVTLVTGRLELEWRSLIMPEPRTSGARAG